MIPLKWVPHLSEIRPSIEININSLTRLRGVIICPHWSEATHLGEIRQIVSRISLRWDHSGYFGIFSPHVTASTHLSEVLVEDRIWMEIIFYWKCLQKEENLSIVHISKTTSTCNAYEKLRKNVFSWVFHVMIFNMGDMMSR